MLAHSRRIPCFALQRLHNLFCFRFLHSNFFFPIQNWNVSLIFNDHLFFWLLRTTCLLNDLSGLWHASLLVILDLRWGLLLGFCMLSSCCKDFGCFILQLLQSCLWRLILIRFLEMFHRKILPLHHLWRLYIVVDFSRCEHTVDQGLPFIIFFDLVDAKLRNFKFAMLRFHLRMHHFWKSLYFCFLARLLALDLKLLLLLV